eukprot:scaffold2353_cov93-Skeletonema_dohrnii-CCMP3373.AAC.17
MITRGLRTVKLDIFKRNGTNFNRVNPSLFSCCALGEEQVEEIIIVLINKQQHIMLLSNAMPSYGHELLQERLPFPDDSPSLISTNWKMFEINGAVAQGGQEKFFLSEPSLSGFNGCHLFDAEWGTVPSSSMITFGIGSISMNECSWMTRRRQTS